MVIIHCFIDSATVNFSFRGRPDLAGGVPDSSAGMRARKGGKETN
jgi:hypothetical protein